MSTPTNTSMSMRAESSMAGSLGSGDILVSDAPGACASTTLRPAPRARPCQRSKTPDRDGRQHPPGHLCDRGIQPYPPRRATSPDTATPEPLNKAKGRGTLGASVAAHRVCRRWRWWAAARRWSLWACRRTHPKGRRVLHVMRQHASRACGGDPSVDSSDEIMSPPTSESLARSTLGISAWSSKTMIDSNERSCR